MPQNKIQSTQIQSIQAAQITGILSTAQGGTGNSDIGISRSNLEAAKSGANSDITSLSGLTTPLSVAQGGTSQNNKTAAFNELSPATTKGDIIANNGTSNIRLAVGIDGQVLMADSASTTGLKWAPGAVGTVTSIDISGGSTGLTATGGPITSSGILTLGGTLAVANGGTGLTSAPGSSGQLLFNNSGLYGAVARLSYNGSDTLSVGAIGTTFNIVSAGGSGQVSASNLSISAGNASNNFHSPGSLTLKSGDGAGTLASGGNITIQTGTPGGGGSAGTLFVNISSTERLRITSSGAWGLSGANYGTTGQVLTSNGSDGAPTWQTPETPSSTDITTSLGYTPVNKAGDTMTGALTLSGAPTDNLHAATKQYVDSTISAGVFSGGTVPNATTFSSAVTLSSSLAFGTAYTESTSNVTASATTNIDCSLSNNFVITMSSNITSLTFSNVPVSGRLFYLALIIRQDATGGRTLAWSSSIKWPSGVAPVITATANKYDIITIMTYDGGTSWSGFVAGQNY